MTKRRKIIIYLDIHRDVWTLISRQCEWPEQSSLSMVCKAARDGIHKNVVDKSVKEWVREYMITEIRLSLLQTKLGGVIIVLNNMNERFGITPCLCSIVNIIRALFRCNVRYDFKKIIGPTLYRFASTHGYIKK